MEIRGVIRDLANKKTPGIDGLPGELYKKYIDIFAPKLQRVFEAAWDRGLLPATAREVLIVPLPKSGQNGAIA